MKKLTLFDKNFISIAYAEERVFGALSAKRFLESWNRHWTEISYAESGLLSLLDKPTEKKEESVVNRCEIGDTSCFMLRNS